MVFGYGNIMNKIRFIGLLILSFCILPSCSKKAVKEKAIAPIAGTKNLTNYLNEYSRTSSVTGYGEISKRTGRIRNKIVSGYRRANGAWVNSYARS